MIQQIARPVTVIILFLVTLYTISVCWSGYRVTSAMNHGALRAKVAQCMSLDHLELRESNRVPQRIVDQVLIRQIAAYYFNNPKRKLGYGLLMQSSKTGWQTFWTSGERRDIYDSLESRLRPCPEAVTRYRELRAAKRMGAVPR